MSVPCDISDPTGFPVSQSMLHSWILSTQPWDPFGSYHPPSVLPYLSGGKGVETSCCFVLPSRAPKKLCQGAVSANHGFISTWVTNLEIQPQPWCCKGGNMFHVSLQISPAPKHFTCLSTSLLPTCENSIWARGWGITQPSTRTFEWRARN